MIHRTFTRAACTAQSGAATVRGIGVWVQLHILGTLPEMRSADTLPPDGLRDVHAPPSSREYFGSVLARREYIVHVARSELKSRHMNTALGNLWHLLNPTLQMAIYFLVFGVLLGVDRGIDNFIAFLAIGIFTFGFTQRATTSGAGSIINNRGLLTTLSFPRAMLPITSTITEALATTSPLVVMYVIALLTGETPSIRWLALPFLFVVQTIFNGGAAMIAARAANTVRDITQVLPLIFRLLFYASGLLFDPERYLSENSKYEWVFIANPLFCLISLARWCILGGDFDARLAVVLLIWTVALSVGGFLFFRAGEATYGRE